MVMLVRFTGRGKVVGRCDQDQSVNEHLEFRVVITAASRPVTTVRCTLSTVVESRV